MSREYSKKELLKRCNAEINQQILDVNQLFSEHKEDILITSPLPAKWSAKQCVEHLNKTLELYLPRIEGSLLHAQKDGRDTLKHGRLGYKFMSDMLPSDSKKGGKMKTFKSLKPGVSGVSSIDVVMDFALLMKQLSVYADDSAYLNIQKLRVTSAMGRVLRFRLGDVYPFLLNHNRRHIIQAQRAVDLCKKHVD